MLRDLPSLNALRAFEAAARLESMSRAGDELYVTHGAVSRQIRALEAELGLPLFQRQGRGVTLTAAGQRLRDATAMSLGQLRDACRDIRHDAVRAPFVLGCPGSLLARWVIPRLERLGSDLPDLSLHLSALEEPLPHALDGFDAALLLAAPPWPKGWRVDVLAPETVGPVVSPRYGGWPSLQGKPASCLLDEPLLHTASRPQAAHDWAQATHLPAPPPAGQGFPHLYYLLEAAVAGLGVAIVPAPLVTDELAAGRLLAPWGFVPTAAAWILAVPERLHDSRAPALAAWLRAELADGGNSPQARAPLLGHLPAGERRLR